MKPKERSWERRYKLMINDSKKLFEENQKLKTMLKSCEKLYEQENDNFNKCNRDRLKFKSAFDKLEKEIKEYQPNPHIMKILNKDIMMNKAKILKLMKEAQK